MGASKTSYIIAVPAKGLLRLMRVVPNLGSGQNGIKALAAASPKFGEPFIMSLRKLIGATIKAIGIPFQCLGKDERRARPDPRNRSLSRRLERCKIESFAR